MKLREILADCGNFKVLGNDELEITGVTSNSKAVEKGHLFIAKKGAAHDGSQYIHESIERGASAILTPEYSPNEKDVTQIISTEIPRLEPLIAAEFFQHPSDALLMIGITGTNGKTTTSFIIKHLLDHFLGPCGLIGTIQYIVGTKVYPAPRTTPDVISNYKMLREMVDNGSKSAVMEVTSHGLDQGRVEGIEFDVGLFTNLTLDHLDYHQTMKEYAKAKSKLFEKLGETPRKRNIPKAAVINLDSPWSSQMIKSCKVPIITYGMTAESMIHARDIQFEKEGTSLKISYQDRTLPCFLPMAGRFNVYNCLGAMGVLLSQTYPFEEIIDLLATIPAVKGRLEPVDNDLGIKIFVDFAHSDDSLTNTLQTLSEIKKGRLLVVFGCGGDRDKTKRPKMAEAAERLADLIIVTSDNPRTERPEDIIQDIIIGFRKPHTYLVELDRRQAIEKAISLATKDDIILIAGKGHETYQIFHDRTLPFDDAKIAFEACKKLSNLSLTH